MFIFKYNIIFNILYLYLNIILWLYIKYNIIFMFKI